MSSSATRLGPFLQVTRCPREFKNILHCKIGGCAVRLRITTIARKQKQYQVLRDKIRQKIMNAFGRALYHVIIFCYATNIYNK